MKPRLLMTFNGDIQNDVETACGADGECPFCFTVQIDQPGTGNKRCVQSFGTGHTGFFVYCKKTLDILYRVVFHQCEDQSHSDSVICA